jgi:hypothetical protein
MCKLQVIKKEKKGKKKVAFYETTEDLNNGKEYGIEDVQPRNNSDTDSFKVANSQMSGLRHTRKHPSNFILPKNL